MVRTNRWTAALVAGVAGGGAFVLLLYRFVSVGTLGPLPDMSEPFWYTKKSLSLTGELIALLGFARAAGLQRTASFRRSLDAAG